MSLYEFEEGDLLFNQVKTYPQVSLFIYDGKVIYNNNLIEKGKFSSKVRHVDAGDVSLYELNVDRPAGQLIYPFVVKGSDREAFKFINKDSFDSNFNFGDILTGSYPLSSSITSERFDQNVTSNRQRIDSLRTSLEEKRILSPHFAYNSELGNKDLQELRLISIPSIMYGSEIKKGSVSLKFFISGTLTAELKDTRKNGELRQVRYSSGSTVDKPEGSVAGVVLYDAGCIILTGAWGLDPNFTEDYTGAGASEPRWVDFGEKDNVVVSSAFGLAFSGTSYVPTTTMFAHAPKGELNYSNNPTYTDFNFSSSLNNVSSGSYSYIENPNVRVKNIVSSSFLDSTASFEKTTYINSIGIYDEYKNLIAVAKVSSPIRKREKDGITFKLHMDL